MINDLDNKCLWKFSNTWRYANQLVIAKCYGAAFLKHNGDACKLPVIWDEDLLQKLVEQSCQWVVSYFN